MSRSHDRLTHTIRQLKTSLRTGATPVVPMRATESGKCQTSISVQGPVLQRILRQIVIVSPIFQHWVTPTICRKILGKTGPRSLTMRELYVNSS